MSIIMLDVGSYCTDWHQHHMLEKVITSHDEHYKKLSPVQASDAHASQRKK